MIQDLRYSLFANGCATALVITDPAAPAVRVTDDVDAVAAVASLAEYHRLGGVLRALGFSQTDGGHLGLAVDGLQVERRVLCQGRTGFRLAGH